MNEFYPEGKLSLTMENKSYLKNLAKLTDAYNEEKILEARAVICDSFHNLIVDLGFTKGIIPREEGAIGIKEGTVRDIAIISRVNRPVCFVVIGFERLDNGEIRPVLSRRLAQEKCMEHYVNNLRIGDVIDVRVTHMEPFGIFADIGCGIASLMPIDTISISRIEHPRERFSVGMDIRAIVKTTSDGRISLSHKELLGTWNENVDIFTVGETVAGIIRSIEDYGVFVELTPNLAGLAELKDDIIPGQQASVYIKNIIPDKMKIKLIIIETFNYSFQVSRPDYFYNENHIEKFVYSPDGADKIIETVFE